MQKTDNQANRDTNTGVVGRLGVIPSDYPFNAVEDIYTYCLSVKLMRCLLSVASVHM